MESPTSVWTYAIVRSPGSGNEPAGWRVSLYRDGEFVDSDWAWTRFGARVWLFWAKRDHSYQWGKITLIPLEREPDIA